MKIIFGRRAEEVERERQIAQMELEEYGKKLAAIKALKTEFPLGTTFCYIKGNLIYPYFMVTGYTNHDNEPAVMCEYFDYRGKVRYADFRDPDDLELLRICIVGGLKP